MSFKDKEKQKEYMKAYYEKNKEKHNKLMKAYNKEYYKTPIGKKYNTINSWKRKGVIHDDFNLLYETYINTNNCDVCKNKFKSSRDRHLDHDHETNLFRQILCCNCNIKDNWKKKIEL
jgi:hypothetical protein